MNNICVTAANAMQMRCKCDAKREDRTERRYTDMRYIGISGYRESERPGNQETRKSGDRETERPRAEIRRWMESK